MNISNFESQHLRQTAFKMLNPLVLHQAAHVVKIEQFEQMIQKALER